MYSIRPWLYVGKYRETKDADLLRQHQIGAMLQLAEGVELPGITLLFIFVEDGVPLPIDALRKGVEFVRSEKAQGHNVLIACGAGISRSVAFAVAVLKEEEDLSLREALGQVRAKHPEAMPHPALLKSLSEYYGEDVPHTILVENIQ